ncbi:MAG: hypothetical protein ACFB0E_16715 [Leptolyngbyaceae cyanobacterium]
MHSDSSPPARESAQPSQQSEAITSDSIPLRIIVSGTRKNVLSTIHTFHALGFAEVREWSLLQQGRLPGQFMSILTRKIVVR